jgi:hypothetical protein
MTSRKAHQPQVSGLDFLFYLTPHGGFGQNILLLRPRFMSFWPSRTYIEPSERGFDQVEQRLDPMDAQRMSMGWLQRR